MYDKDDLKLIELVLDGKYQILEHTQAFRRKKQERDEFKALTKCGKTVMIVVDFDGELISIDGVLCQKD